MPRRGLAGASLLILTGVLCLGTGIAEGLGRAAKPIRTLAWVWLCIDLLVPLFFLRMSAALRQRDALELELVAAAMRDPLTGLHNRAGFAEAAAGLLEPNPTSLDHILLRRTCSGTLAA